MVRYRVNRKGAYGFVNMISCAPSDHRVRCGERYVCVGMIPHVTGSSNLPGSARYQFKVTHAA